MFEVSLVKNNVETNIVKTNEDELCKLITQNVWSPFKFKNNKRLIENFESTSLLVLDVDHGCTLPQAKAKLAGFKAIFAPSRNHDKEKNGVVCNRFRVILFLNDVITDPNTYRATWAVAKSILPEIDDAAKDVARQYFPSLFIDDIIEGRLFPVQHVLIDVTHTRVQSPPIMKYPVPQYVQDFMDHGARDWNSTLYKSSKFLQEAGYEEEDAIELLSNMSNAQYKGVLDYSDIKTIKSAFGKPGKYSAKINWPVKIQTKSGSYIPDAKHHENLLYLFNDILKLELKFNELRNRIELSSKAFSDLDFSAIRLKALEFELKPSNDLIYDIINKIALSNKFHPFKQLITNKPWDKEERIFKLFKEIEIEGEEKPIYYTYFRRFLVATVARVFSPGAQNNMLVLMGKQAAGKSRFFERFNVAPGTYTESHLDPTNKDDMFRATQNILWNVNELDASLRKKDIAAIKAFISATAFDIRQAYDKYSSPVVPIASFVASVNSEKFLNDETGSRRFLVIPVKSLNPNHNIDMQQVWAEAYEAYISGERYWFDKGEVEEVNSENEEYEVTHRLTIMATKLETGDEELTLDEIMDIMEYSTKRFPSDYAILGKTLSKMGFDKTRKKIKGIKFTVYKVNKEKIKKAFEV